LAVVLAACRPVAGSPAATAVAAPCPVTLAFQLPPDEAIDFMRAGSSAQPTHEEAVAAARRTNWAGNDGIWVVLPNDGVVTWGSTTFGSKFGLYAFGTGRMTATARRFGGVTPPGFEASIGTPDQGYGPPGFIASGLTFPSNGCWEVTYRIAERSVTFVVDVQRK